MEIYSFPYILLVVFYLVLAIYEHKSKKIKRTRFIAALIFIFFFGFRGYIGTDWYNYEIYYNNISFRELSFVDKEIGYALLVKLFNLIGVNYLTFVLFLTIIQVYLWDKFISKYAISISLSYILIIALFPILIDLQRNFTSILIVINALPLLQKNKKKNYLLMVLIGMLFHISAAVFIIFIFLKDKIINKKTLVLLLIIGIIVYTSQVNFYQIALQNLANALGGYYEKLIMQGVSEDETSYGISFGIIEKFALYILLLVLYPRLKKYPPIIINCCFVFLLINFYFSTSQTFINRFAVLFFSGYILTYGYLLNSLKSRAAFKLALMIVVLFALLRTYFSYNNVLYRYTNNMITVDDISLRSYDRSNYYYFRK
jgi:hypothetical protein